MNRTAKEYQNQCDNCKHCNAIHGACNLQDFYHCVSICMTWADVYKNCPIKEQSNNK